MILIIKQYYEIYLKILYSGQTSKFHCAIQNSLHQDLEPTLVGRIRHHQATLLDFRNYLFTRKARLLAQLKQNDELARMAQNYVASRKQSYYFNSYAGGVRYFSRWRAVSVKTIFFNTANYFSQILIQIIDLKMKSSRITKNMFPVKSIRRPLVFTETIRQRGSLSEFDSNFI